MRREKPTVLREVRTPPREVAPGVYVAGEFDLIRWPPPGLNAARMAAVRCDERALGPVEDWPGFPKHVAQEAAAKSLACRRDFWSWLRDSVAAALREWDR